jgi:T/G mismatch-specific endonuclease (EC 3.1.-.-)
MTDVLTPEQRKYNMSRIRAKDTVPETILRKFLSDNGIQNFETGYHLKGKPDIILAEYRIAIFIDGCFWHKCPVHFSGA